MSNNIYAALEQVGLTTQKCAIHVLFSNSALNDQIFLQRINGKYVINESKHLELICLSTSANRPLKNFIGSQIAIDIVNEKSELNRLSGIVTKADSGASDGSLTICYLMVEEPSERNKNYCFLPIHKIRQVVII